MKLRILQGDLSPAESEHLSRCADCLEYSRTINRIQDQAADLEPPKHLDHLVKSYARRQNRAGRTKRMIYFKLIASAAAAVLAVLVGAEAYRRWHPHRLAPTKQIVKHRPAMQTLPKISEQMPKAPEHKKPQMVVNFDWDNDPVETELAQVQAEFLLLTADDEDAAMVSALMEQ